MIKVTYNNAGWTLAECPQCGSAWQFSKPGISPEAAIEGFRHYETCPSADAVDQVQCDRARWAARAIDDAWERNKI